jgi:hypothetical protein
MRRVLLWGLLALLVLGGFYVAWPVWTARQIRNAIEANDPAALERKVDFASVRERAKPLLAAEVERSLQKSGSIGSVIAGQLKDRLGTKVTDAAVDTILTPGNVVAVVRQGRNWRRFLRGWRGDRTGTGEAPPGGEGSTGDASAGRAVDRPHRLTLANIKSYRITGPLSLAVGAARDPAAAEPDVTVELAFTGADWKVVGIVPRS